MQTPALPLGVVPLAARLEAEPRLGHARPRNRIDLPTVLDSARMFGRYAAGLRTFLRTSLTEDECVERARRGLENRESAFLDMLDRAVYRSARSPYRTLLAHAGVELGDVAGLVRDTGIEGALERLYDAGVYVTMEEFRGKRAIERNGLSRQVRPEDFDNLLSDPAWQATTGGSRSEGRRVLLNFPHLETGIVYNTLLLIAHGATDRPQAVWHPVFPSRTGLNNALRSAMVGRPLERWFSQSGVHWNRGSWQSAFLLQYVRLACRRAGKPLPAPEHVPLPEAVRVARWLETKARERAPALLGAPVGSGVRVCLAAREHGLDIGGTLFRLGGEPLTSARAEVVSSTGSKVLSSYSMAELGRVGIPCAAPAAVDDLHLMTDKVSVLVRPRSSGAEGDALYFTGLHSSAPKLMINVETDDFATLEDRECGCAIGELGYARHLHGIRSYEKLTSEGMTFHGTEVVTLVEETLPARFGGGPTDYQLVDQIDTAVPAVAIVVSPGVGEVDEAEVVRVVHEAIEQSGAGPALASAVWRDGGTLRVVRREPFATAPGKVLPIHTGETGSPPWAPS